MWSEKLEGERALESEFGCRVFNIVLIISYFKVDHLQFLLSRFESL